MLKRKVVELSTDKNKQYALKLECGHTIKRHSRCRAAPQTTAYCDECVRVLERMERAGDLVHARDVKSSKAVLRFLENEGLVESRRPIGTQTIYWKLLHPL